MLFEALLKAQVLENDVPYITVVSIIYNLKFRFYKKKIPYTQTSVLIEQCSAFSTSELQLRPDVVTSDGSISMRYDYVAGI